MEENTKDNFNTSHNIGLGTNNNILPIGLEIRGIIGISMINVWILWRKAEI